jgi:hypothetical protein
LKSTYTPKQALKIFGKQRIPPPMPKSEERSPSPFKLPVEKELPKVKVESAEAKKMRKHESPKKLLGSPT